MTDNMSGYPRFTVVTSTYNCLDSLEKTAQSIREQTYENIQWIVADGASTDGTVEVIKNNLDVVSDWHSEPDGGIYDAWNKACQLIDGDWVLFLGAGDRFYSETSLFDLSDKLKGVPDDCVLCYGNVQIEKPDGTPRYVCRKPRLDYFEFGRPALPHHQGVLHRSSLFSSKTPFDKTYKIAADGKFLLQALRTGSIAHIDIVMSRMVDDGASNTYSNIFVARNEFNTICKELGIKIPLHHQIIADAKWLMLYLGHFVLPVSFVSKIQKVQDLRRILSSKSKK